MDFFKESLTIAKFKIPVWFLIVLVIGIVLYNRINFQTFLVGMAVILCSYQTWLAKEDKYTSITRGLLRTLGFISASFGLLGHF